MASWEGFSAALEADDVAKLENALPPADRHDPDAALCAPERALAAAATAAAARAGKAPHPLA